MSRSDRILIATAGIAVLLAVAAAVVLFVPDSAAEADEFALAGIPTPSTPIASPGESAVSLPDTIVIDVAGAVQQPGIVQLPAGTRIGDALAAAGGYAVDADLDAAATTLNLAQPLTDGEQVRVPRVGDAAAGAEPPPSAGSGGATGGGATTGGGLVDLNTATPEQLEALPGIGPVTVQKIVAARQEQPFSSLEDAHQRGVIHRGQLDSIRELATAG